MEKNLQQLFNEYINESEYSARLRPETIRGYKAVFTLFLKEMPEVNTLKDLNTEIMNEFFKRIQTRKRIVGRDTIKTGVKNSTIKTQWSKLHAFFIWLMIKGYLTKNPLKEIKKPYVSYTDYRRLKDKEIHQLYSCIIIQSPNSLVLRRDTLMISLLFYCGLRKGEFISLRVDDIDMETKEITIRAETSKSKNTRTLKMHPTLVLHLKEYLKERKIRAIKTEKLIVSSKEDRGLTPHGLKHWYESLNKKSGVKFHLHQFRHTFACKLAEEDVSLFKIQKMMGHLDIGMTMRYSRSLKTEDMAEDIGKIRI